MGKQKKKHPGQPASAPPGRRVSGLVSNMRKAFAPNTLGRRITGQVVLIASLSTVLGLMFNASNPLGIQWTQSAVAAQLPADAAQLPADPAPPLEDEIPEIASNIVALPPAPSPDMPAAPSVDVRSVTDIFPPMPPTVEGRPTPATVAAANDPAPMPAATNPVRPSVTTPNVYPADERPVVQNPTPIRWPEVDRLVNGGQTILVDARSRHAYEAAHIPGAVSLPNASAPAEIQAFMEKFPPGTTAIVIYCGNERCSLSRQLAFKLVHQYGYRNVRYMPGGIQEWQQAQVRR